MRCNLNLTNYYTVVPIRIVLLMVTTWRASLALNLININPAGRLPKKRNLRVTSPLDWGVSPTLAHKLTVLLYSEAEGMEKW
jgi:hypothetical protein